MPRKGHVKKRITPPDSVYANPAISKFINCLMLGGKKSTAERIFYGALDLAGSRLSIEPAEVFEKAMTNVRPLVEVRPRRVGGATYQVPVEVKPERAQALAIRWIINFAKSRSGQTMSEKLAAELLDAFNSRGASVKKKDDTHKMAEANKAFAHYR